MSGRDPLSGDRHSRPPGAPGSGATAGALVLRSLPGIGPARFRALVDRFGDPEAALHASRSAFVAEVGCDPRSRAPGGGAGPAEEILRRCSSLGIAVVPYGSAAYPRGLRHLVDPPPVLFMRGNVDLVSRPCVAVIGARRATAYGRRVARALASSLASQGSCVVSGMALGIDGEAHRGALPGPTIAVLGSGIDVPYPRSHRRLYGEILAAGLVLSEHEPGVAAQPHHFPRRNRIIAALATDVIVVEASHKSGALITASVALELGKEVHAVPGPVDRPTSAGTNRLISDGAGVILDVALGSSAPPPTVPPEPELRRLLDALPATPVTVDHVAGLLGLPVAEVAARVTVLELRGFVTPTRDGRILRTPGAGPGLVRERRAG